MGTTRDSMQAPCGTGQRAHRQRRCPRLPAERPLDAGKAGVGIAEVIQLDAHPVHEREV
jgi:hypothetical protein